MLNLLVMHIQLIKDKMIYTCYSCGKDVEREQVLRIVRCPKCGCKIILKKSSLVRKEVKTE